MAAKGRLIFTADSNIAELLGLDPAPPTPSLGPHCSYCDRDLSESEGTVGAGPLVKRVEQIAIRDAISNDIIGYKDEVKYTSSKLLACNDCCLNLVARLERDKHGNVKVNDKGEPVYTRSKTKFEPFD